MSQNHKDQLSVATCGCLPQAFFSRSTPLVTHDNYHHTFMEYDFAAPPVAPPVDPDNYYHPLMDYDNILFTFYAKAKMVFKLLATK
jgi:hypothetical protein